MIAWRNSCRLSCTRSCCESPVPSCPKGVPLDSDLMTVKATEGPWTHCHVQEGSLRCIIMLEVAIISRCCWYQFQPYHLCASAEPRIPFLLKSCSSSAIRFGILRVRRCFSIHPDFTERLSELLYPFCLFKQAWLFSVDSSHEQGIYTVYIHTISLICTTCKHPLCCYNQLFSSWKAFH